MTQEELADQIIVKLNEILKTDPVAIQRFVAYRVDCNDALVKHPTVQTASNTVGLIGILNGLVGTIQEGPRKGWGLIAGYFDDDDKLAHFQRTNEKK